MARTTRAERPWFKEVERWDGIDSALGRTPHTRSATPLTADGRFKVPKDRTRTRRARRAFQAGDDARGQAILHEWND